MINSILEQRVREYARVFALEVDFKTPLGYGNDGAVWKTTQRTAIKALDSTFKYDKELACYQRFEREAISAIDEFSVPQLIRHNRERLILEITIVSPPYIIDFAKVWLDKQPDYPDDAVEHRLKEAEEDFGEDWPRVARLLWTLKVRFGIYYTDPNLGNIKLRLDAD